MLPFKMKENRVWRLYYGGKLIDEMRGCGSFTDGNFPEDWLASVVVADNPPRENKPVNEGLSVIDSGDYSGETLMDIITKMPDEMLGKAHVEKFGANFGVLTKYLDSSERLPVQCHPTKETAKRLFNSDYGKTESWYILGGRKIDGEDPYIFLGFKKEIDKETLKKLFDKQDIKGMTEYLHKIYVKPGDVFLIAGGTPHAIGPGCMLLEVQEPTDYTISLEKCDLRGKRMPDHLCHMGLGFDLMFDCFNYVCMDIDELKAKYKLNSMLVENGSGHKYESLITYDDTPCFSLNRLTVKGKYTRKTSGRACCMAVVKGCGFIKSESESFTVKAGDCLFEPASAKEYIIESSEGCEILFCNPPKL